MLIARKLGAHIETWRPYTSFYAGLLALSAATLWQHGLSTLPIALLTFAAPTLGWIAGLYGCDYFDRDLDAIQKKHRPIPSGRMSPREAFMCMMVCMYLGFMTSAWLGFGNLILAGAVMAASVIYTVAKSYAIWGNVSRGLPGCLTCLFGIAVVEGGKLPLTPLLPLLALVLLFFLHDTTTNLVGAIRDVEGDRAGNCVTVPVKYGVRFAAFLALALTVGWELLALSLPTLLPLRPDYYGLYIPALLCAVAGIGTVLLRPEQRHAALFAHKCFVIERLLLAGSLLAGGAGVLPALLVVVPLIVITQWSQSLLRNRHEFGVSGSSSGQATPVADSSVSDEEIEQFIQNMLTQLSTQDKAAALLKNWNRRCQIQITDRGIVACFVSQEGQIRRFSPDEFASSGLPALQIQTTSEVFAAIFLEHRLSPASAYARGAVRMSGSPTDMLRLNRIFGFIMSLSAPRSKRSVEAVVERQPAAEPVAKRPVIIADTTLRDGEQMPGVRFTPEQKLALARALDNIGIPLLEVGYPAVSSAEQEAIAQIVKARLNASIQVISRPVPHEIDLAVATGVDSVALFIGTSELHLKQKLGISQDRLCQIVEQGVRYAKKHAIQVAFAPEDATRTDREFLARICGIAIEAGVDAIGIPDTVGVMTPGEMHDLISYLVATLQVPIAAHCHDDFGLATANSLAAIQAGAAAVQCSLGGIGERAGNAPLEEVACALHVLHGYPVQLDMSRFQAATELLYSYLPFAAAPNKAITGKYAFTHESGLHTSGVIREPATYEPFDPALVGGQRHFVFGKHSGRKAMAHVLAQADQVLSADELDALAQQVKNLGDAGISLTEEDLVHLAQKR